MAEPHTHGGTDAPECTTCRPTLDPAHVEAVARLLHDGNPNSGIPWGDKNGFHRSPYRVRARQILTSTDPAVHAALLAALVRAEVLRMENGIRASFCPCGCGDADDIPRRRYATRWEDA